MAEKLAPSPLDIPALIRKRKDRERHQKNRQVRDKEKAELLALRKENAELQALLQDRKVKHGSNMDPSTPGGRRPPLASSSSVGSMTGL